MTGPEYTVAVLGERALPSIRIDVVGEFYDFDAKYRSDETRFTCPSDLASDVDERAELCRTSHWRHSAAVGGEVWGRVDVIRERCRGSGSSLR